MQITCPQCQKLLEAPYPLPEMAKCPYCEAVFKPIAPVAAPLVPVAGQSVPATWGPSPTIGPASRAADRLRAPAIILLVTSVLYIVGSIVDLVTRVLIVNDQFQIPPALVQFFDPNAVRIGMGTDLIGVIFGVIMVLGAARMLQRRNYGLAMTASILSLVPCSLCCCLTFPFGIWALVVLSQPEVRSSFQ